MKAGITGSDSLKEAAGKMRLQQTIASKGGSEHANFLCDLGIVEVTNPDDLHICKSISLVY